MIAEGKFEPMFCTYHFNPKEGWRMENVYRFQAINKTTIRHIFSLPRMDDFMDCLSGAKYFSKVYLKGVYH